MNLNTDLYKLENVEGETLKYIFISQGKEIIIKAIEYQYVQSLSNYQMYNLAFGNYDLENDELVDDVVSNNEDGRKVFNTVLSTIPTFFGNYSDGMLMVGGSDSSEEFLEKCKSQCSKCTGNCRKLDQRIRIYTNYINTNYETLIEDYKFYGGIPKGDFVRMVPYNTLEKDIYKIVYVIKKKQNE